MKISPSSLKPIPKNITEDFGMCVYGNISETIQEWISTHKFKVENFSNYHNIFFPKDILLTEIFTSVSPIEYMDGFSPNLNKHLHIGHMSNLVIAKCLQSMNVADKSIAILGDTLNGEVSKEEALKSYHEYCKKFNYKIDKLFFASEMSCESSFLENGTDQYLGTKIFNISETEKVVGIKSDGSTSYFYQDFALAKKLNNSTIYLTGYEQAAHFNLLKKLFPHITHLPIGLVKVNGLKMSSSIGNVIMSDEILNLLMEEFNQDSNLCYNIFSGFILKASPKSDKNIDMKQISNPLNSPGLYLSYTLAKLKSAGVNIEKQNSFSSQKLQYKLLKAKETFQFNLFFEELTEHAKYISTLYATNHIKGNKENLKMFKILGDDLLTGMEKLGMFNVDKV